MLCKCSGKYIDIYFILKITYMEKPDGIEYLIRKLDQLFLVDESRRQFRAFQELYNLRRTVDSDVGEFVN